MNTPTIHNVHTNNISQPEEIPIPGFKDTFVFRGPKFLYNKSIGRLFNAQTADHVVWEASSAIPANAQSESRRRKLKK
jgi:hypothetical protein